MKKNLSFLFFTFFAVLCFSFEWNVNSKKFIESNNSDSILYISGKGRIPDFNSGAEVPWAKYCNQITEVEFEDGITSVGDYAFINFTNLESVKFSENIKRIGKGAFYNCKRLSEIFLPCNLKNIDDFAFYGCFQKIGSYAFADCNSIESIEVYTAIPYADNTAFFGAGDLVLRNRVTPNIEEVNYKQEGEVNAVVDESLGHCILEYKDY